MIFTKIISHFKSAVPIPTGERVKPIKAVKSIRNPKIPMNKRRFKTPLTLSKSFNFPVIAIMPVKNNIVTNLMTMPTENMDISSTAAFVAT